MIVGFFNALACGTLIAACDGSGQPGPLPPLGATLDETSVSGISSGAYMAGQFQMAHASIVKGAAIIAGGPYGCSESVFAEALPGPGTEFLNLSKAVNGCMLNMLGAWGVGDPVDLARKAKQRAENGDIDSISYVVPDRVYLFSGEDDHTVMPALVKAAAQFYEQLGVPSENIQLVTEIAQGDAGHAFVTENAGKDCERSGDPYVVHCGYDQAGALLQHIYGPLVARSAAPGGEWLEFDQRPYFRDLGLDGMSSSGMLYIPKVCRAESGCRVHIAYHGCAQNRDKVGDVFVKETGFARWADTNKIMVLFPQTAITAINPQGCWDWWGYTGRAYLTRKAPQIVAVRRMLDALAGAR